MPPHLAKCSIVSNCFECLFNAGDKDRRVQHRSPHKQHTRSSACLIHLCNSPRFLESDPTSDQDNDCLPRPFRRRSCAAVAIVLPLFEALDCLHKQRHMLCVNCEESHVGIIDTGAANTSYRYRRLSGRRPSLLLLKRLFCCRKDLLCACFRKPFAQVP